MNNKKATGIAVIIAIVIILIIFYIVYKGHVKPIPNGQPQDGIEYVPPGAKDLGHNEI